MASPDVPMHTPHTDSRDGDAGKRCPKDGLRVKRREEGLQGTPMGQQRSTEGHVDMHVPTPTRACTTVSSTTHTGTCMTLWASHHTSLLPSCRDMTSTPHQCSRVTGHPTHDTVSYMSTLPHTSPHLHMHAHGTAPQRCSLLPCPCTSSWTHA